MHLDQRAAKISISNAVGHDLECFHHAYCVARACYTNTQIGADCYGSTIMFPIEADGFDFIDLSFAQTIGIRFDHVGFIYVPGDGGAVLEQMETKILTRIEKPLTSAQFREAVAHFACCSLHQSNPPKYATFTDTDMSFVRCVERDVYPVFFDYEPTILGRLMLSLLGSENEEHEKHMLEGRVTYFDS